MRLKQTGKWLLVAAVLGLLVLTAACTTTATEQPADPTTAPAEPDEPDAVADANVGALLDPAKNASRHQPGNLDRRHAAMGAFNDDPVAFVLRTRLV